ncbi:MAG: arsenate reductase ArsC [Actinobacteria bacterium]|nr:arsenate reductase ArsC [Actinomycetota bacterium]
MAEAFARVRGAGVLDAQSAGSSPSGTVSPRAIEAMAELGCDLSSHTSKGLSEVGSGPFDYVITMGCGDACPSVKAACREDWTLPDPRSMSDEEFRAVRDEIARRVDELVERVRSSRSQSC